MSLDKLEEDIIQILQSNSGLPHANNLLRKITISRTNRSFINPLNKIVPAYKLMYKKINSTENTKEMVEAVDSYLDVITSKDCRSFSHQSDFISSVIPEFFYTIFLNIINKKGLGFIVKSQEDVIINCNFDPKLENSISFDKKRVDVLVIKNAKFVFNGVDYPEFFIPLIAIEVKTNMDKNMISGIENSVESLKRTFPRCLYFAICEWVDFAFEKQNYANTYIDEIFVLRKQRRSSFRKSGSKSNIDLNVIKSFIKLINLHLDNLNNQITPIKDRMRKGVLIKD